MSGIPSDVAGSALQAGLQQNAASGLQDNEHNRGVDIARKAAQRAAQKEEDVVGDESDMTVNADGGAGGQGRNFSEAPPEEHAEHAETVQDKNDGLTTDEEGRTHIDFEA